MQLIKWDIIKLECDDETDALSKARELISHAMPWYTVLCHAMSKAWLPVADPGLPLVALVVVPVVIRLGRCE